MIKRFLTSFLFCGSLFAAAYVPWRGEFEMWMPLLVGRGHWSVLHRSYSLPFEAPEMKFAVAPMFVRVPFEAADATRFGMAYFSSPGQTFEGPLYAQIGACKNIALPWAPTGREFFGGEIFAVKTLTDCVFLAPWPIKAEGAGEAEVWKMDEGLERSLREVLRNTPDGVYKIRLFL